MKLIKLLHVSLFVCVLLAQSGKAHSQDAGSVELGIKKSSIGYQADVISSFVDSKIPFYIDNEGILKYPGEFKEKAQGILDHLNNRPAAQFKDFRIASLFILFLKKNNVNYLIRHGNGDMDIHILYDEKYRELVDKKIYPMFRKSLSEAIKTGVYKYNDQ
jgi:hypothetical protein